MCPGLTAQSQACVGLQRSLSVTFPKRPAASHPQPCVRASLPVGAPPGLLLSESWGLWCSMGSHTAQLFSSLVVFSRSVVSDSVRPHRLYLTRLLCPQDSPGKNTGMGCHALLQGIFLTQGLKPCLLHWQAGSLPLSHL